MYYKNALKVFSFGANILYRPATLQLSPKDSQL